MAATTFSNSTLKTDTVLWSGASPPLLNTMSYSTPSDPIDNTANASQSPISYTRGLFRLSFSFGQRLIDNPPTRLGLFIYPILDGTNLPSPPGGTSVIFPTSNTKRVEVVLRNGSDTVGQYTVVDFGNAGDPFELGPFKYAFQLYNGTKYPWLGTLTATLYRWNIVNG